jgi:hypothetical protein
MYAIVQLVVEEAMLNGATYITTFETLEEAKEAFKKDIEEEKRFADEREIEYEEDFYEDGDYMEYILKFDDYATKYQLVDLSEKFNSVTF